MEKWDELRTAYWLAQLGTVSEAAAHLGVHRATVVRHVDTLEQVLGGKLFLRHARGYEPTEAGRDLVQVARAAEEQFNQLAGRTQGRSSEVSGELVLTTVELLGPMLMPAVAAFRDAHPDCTVRIEASSRLFKLEYGEAHVAVRLGSRPDHPDNVVQPFRPMRSALYAHRSYVDHRGLPGSLADYADHSFITDAPSSVLHGWLHELAPHAPTVLSSPSRSIRTEAIHAGIGIGFLPTHVGEAHPNLVQVHPPLDAWDVPLWLVSHVDLHRTPKVQAVLTELRALNSR